MNTVEDRLRDALRERAAHSPIDPMDPDAWAHTVSRVRRRRRPASWSRFVIPVTAAAAVIAIVAGAAVLTGLGGQRGGPGATGPTTASPAPSGAPAPPGPGDFLIKGTTLISAIVPVKLVTGGKTTWTFVWFSRPASGPDRSIQLCSVTDGDGYDGSGGCMSPQLQDQQGFTGGTGSIKFIVSDSQVASTTAQLPKGRSVAGVSAWGRGFPDKVWLVNYPEEDNATIVLRNVGGQVVKRLPVTGDYPTPSQPRTGGITLFSFPAGSITPTAGTMTAYLLDGSLVGLDGRVIGFWASDSSSVISNLPASAPQEIVNLGGTQLSGAKVAEYYGYAHQNIARVVLRLPDGRQYGAQTSAAWPGSGLRLWHFAVPSQAATFKPAQQVLLGYDTAGQIVWQKSLRAAS